MKSIMEKRCVKMVFGAFPGEVYFTKDEVAVGYFVDFSDLDENPVRTHIEGVFEVPDFENSMISIMEDNYDQMVVGLNPENAGDWEFGDELKRWRDAALMAIGR